MNMKFLVKSKGKLVRSLQHFRTAEKDKSDKKKIKNNRGEPMEDIRAFLAES